jgi:hypothetical protein
VNAIGIIFRKSFGPPVFVLPAVFSMPGEMITKLLSLLPEIVRHPINAARPQSAIQKRFEWQSVWSDTKTGCFSEGEKRG